MNPLLPPSGQNYSLSQLYLNKATSNKIQINPQITQQRKLKKTPNHINPCSKLTRQTNREKQRMNDEVKQKRRAYR